MLSLTENPSGKGIGEPASKTVGDRLRYRSDWNDLNRDEEERIWEFLTAQVDTTHYRKNLHSMMAEWINENYNLYLEEERHDPSEDAFEVETVRARVTTTLYGGSVCLDIPSERQAVAKKSYTGTPDPGHAIDTAVEEFAENHNLFTRGILNEIEIDDEIDPVRLRGADRYVYRRVAGDFSRRYLRMLKDRIPNLVKVEKG